MAIWGIRALLQCAILQAGANSILWAASSSSCVSEAGWERLHNNLVSCPQMLFHRPGLIPQTSPLLQFPQTFISFIITNKISLRI